MVRLLQELEVHLQRVDVVCLLGQEDSALPGDALWITR